MKDKANEVLCDGCGQTASGRHIARRLERLAWATRYRPVHIQALLVGAVAPTEDAEFFYSPEGAFLGEARRLAEVAELTRLDMSKEQLQVAFQRAGFFAVHVIDCPFEEGGSPSVAELLEKRLPSALIRIRRSLRPKKVALISPLLDPLVRHLEKELAGARLITNSGRAFQLDSAEGAPETALLQNALARDAA
jgi:hypothetical protein